MTRLGELVRLYRVVHSLSVREVAEEIGLHTSTLHRIERADTGLTAENFLKVQAWLLQSMPARTEAP